MLTWGYTTEPDPGVAGRAILYPRGRVLGGSSSINGMIYVRGQPEDFDHWAQLGNRGWGWDDVLSYFKQAESWEGGEDESHGAQGPLSGAGPRRKRRAVAKPPTVEAISRRLSASISPKGSEASQDVNRFAAA